MQKTHEAQTLGTYIPTAIDARKAVADIRILDADRTFTIHSNIALEGKGIVARAVAGRYEVTKAAMTKLMKAHNVECDF